MAMEQLSIREVRLEGFGLYARPAVFTFGDGLNVWVAPNESGKSTLLAGLQAVLFGLPERSDPEPWGTARFRAWSGAPHFRGELVVLHGTTWHRLRRDFATHGVHWATAPAEVPAGAPRGSAGVLIERPQEGAWAPLFTGEHNPAGRGEPAQRYLSHLRRLLGIDDAGLFRLTYLLTQDPEERSPEEATFRSRQVPESVQGLLSGAGGQVDRVLARLFDRYAAITQATAEADLVRPGKTRAANQRTPGRLEVVRERLLMVEKDLAAAEQTLEDLQGSQEKLESLRSGLQGQRESLENDRQLRQAMEEWARLRKERARLNRSVADLERTLRELEEGDRSIREDEARLGREYAEYRSPDFAFDAKRRELEELVAAEQERADRREKLEDARRRRESLEQLVAAGDEEIATRYAAFHERPHLLRDFDAWQEAALELEHLQAELLELDGQIAEQAQVVARYQPWAALEPSAASPEAARPTVHLRALHDQVPRLLGQIEEYERLLRERDRLEQRRREALEAPAAASEAVRAEAEAYTDRRALYRGDSDNAARQLRDIEDRRAEAGRAEQGLALLRDTLAAGTRSRDEARWSELAVLIQRKLEGLHEEADLLRRIEAADRVLHAGLFRVVALPALVALVAVAAAAYTLSLAAKADPTWRIAIAAGAGLAGSVAAALLGYWRNKGATRSDLVDSRARLAELRDSLAAADGALGDLADLNGEGLEGLAAQIHAHGVRAAEGKRLRALSPSDEEREAAAAAAAQAERELQEFEARMAPFGADPAGLVAEWRRTESRLAELGPRIAELAEAIGPREWPEGRFADLPETWHAPALLAGLIRERIAPEADGWSNAPGAGPQPPETGREVAEILRQVTTGHWQSWMAEASAYEAAANRLASLRMRRQAQTGGEDPDGGADRGRQLEERAAQLAKSCAPLTLEVPREEVEALARDHARIRAERDRHKTLLEELVAELPKMEEEARGAEQRALGLRDNLRGLLKPAASDPAAAIRRLDAAREFVAELQRGARTRAKVLQTLDAGEVTDLAAKLEAARDESRSAFERVEEMERRFVLLRELSDADAERVQQQQAELDRRIRQAEGSLATLSGQQDSLLSVAADVKAESRRVGNIAALEREAEGLREEMRRLLLERDALAAAFRTLREAVELYSRTHRERLEERATELFRQLSLSVDRSVRLGDQFEIRVTAGGGRVCATRQLSQGARDQLALAVRLAVADLLTGELCIPLFFDDPFLSYDPERLAAIRQTLSRIATERQVVVLSHRPELAEWGRAVVRSA